MLLVPGPRSPLLTERMGRALGAPVAVVESRQFPDHEMYVRVVTPVKGEDVVIVQTTQPNEEFMAACLMEDAVRRHGARTVTLVVPYFAYARQDKVFKEGEAVSAEAVMRVLGANVDRVVTVDLHRPETLKVLDLPTHNVSAVPAIAAHFEKRPPHVVLAPDKNALARAEEAAKLLGAEVDHMVKRRVADDTVEVQPRELDVNGKRVLIIDDIISTGGTMMKSAHELRRQGAKVVNAACTHGLFAPGAIEKLHVSGIQEVVATDTIEGAASTVTVADELARVLRAPF